MTGPRSEPRWAAMAIVGSLSAVHQATQVSESDYSSTAYIPHMQSPQTPTAPAVILQQARDNGGDGEYEMKIPPRYINK